jgi:hypothetical protein
VKEREREREQEGGKQREGEGGESSLLPAHALLQAVRWVCKHHR